MPNNGQPQTRSGNYIAVTTNKNGNLTGAKLHFEHDHGHGMANSETIISSDALGLQEANYHNGKLDMEMNTFSGDQIGIIPNPRRIDSDIALNIIENLKDKATTFVLNGKDITPEKFDQLIGNLRIAELKLEPRDLLNSGLEFKKEGYGNTLVNDLEVIKSAGSTYKKAVEGIESDGNINESEYEKLKQLAEQARTSAKASIVKG